MKKLLITSILTLSTFLVKAQTGTYDDIFFNNLHAKWTQGNSLEQPNYQISNTLTGFGGDWGLDVKWWGGVKLRSASGIFYINRYGNVGINTETPTATLDVNGNFQTTGNTTTSDIISSGSNSWIFHTPDDGRSSLYITPKVNGDWDWSKQTIFNNGNIAVSGKLEAKEVKVTQTPTADFVFEADYNLPTLEEVEKHIKEKKHLPEIASAKDMEKEGVNVGEFQIKLLQKIEELTLYTIEQNKEIKKLKEENKNLKVESSQIKLLLERIEKLEKNKN